jgi:hypothetical protein
MLGAIHRAVCKVSYALLEVFIIIFAKLSCFRLTQKVPSRPSADSFAVGLRQ